MNSYKQPELNRYFLLYTFVLLASIQLWAKTATIRIQKQSQFDILHSMLDSMVLSYDCINVIFDSGKYYFNSDNGINISKNNNCEITFRGSGKVVFSSKGDDYSKSESVGSYEKDWYIVPLKKQLDKYSTFQDEEGLIVPLCDTGFLNDSLITNISSSQIEVVDSAGGVARILVPSECKDMLNNNQDYFQNSQICYKSQWADAYRPILYSDSKYLYFQLNDWLKKNIKNYVTNGYEWGGTYGGTKSQAFFVTNIPFALKKGQIMWDDKYIYIPKNIKMLHVSRFHEFASFRNCSGKISFDNLTFCGSAIAPFVESWSGYPDTFPIDLFSFREVKSVFFSNCRFTSLGVNVCRSYDSSGLSVTNCKFDENYTDGIMSLQRCKDVTIEKNKVQNSHKITTCKSVFSFNKCSNCVVQDNEFTNVSRTILSLGESSGEDNIKVIGNIARNTDEFNKFHRRNMSSDTGVLVYGWGGAQCEITNNVVYNIASNHGFHGIMIDDGVGNVAIRNNLMFNIGDECIHNWKYESSKPLNLNNKLENNILLGKVNYCGYNIALSNNASYSNNVIQKLPTNTHNHIMKATEIEPNTFLTTSDFKVKGKKVAVPKEIYNRFKSVSNVCDYLIKK